MPRRLVSRLAQARLYVCQTCRRRSSTLSAERTTFHATTTSSQDTRSLLAILDERGLVNQVAGNRSTFDELLRTKKLGFYAGIDPTAPSLHLGHLLPLMVLFWASICGHRAISLIGGGTARVGDPSGRLVSRANVEGNVQKSNTRSMFMRTEDLWANAAAYAQRHEHEMRHYKLLNNEEWLDKLNVLDFLKVLGNGMRVGAMLGRDTVRNKMEKGDGMSFAEFTYPLLQGWDWWHMYQSRGVQIQVGGSDQYGNIVAGMDAVRYIAQDHEHKPDVTEWLDKEGRLKDDFAPMGLTVPLLTTAKGEKFGKSAGNAMWLDSRMTSAFDLYGFLLRSADTDVERYLKLFTFLPIAEITEILIEHRSDPSKRKAQHLLASEVLELVHGEQESIRTKAEHHRMRNPSTATLHSSIETTPTSQPSASTEEQRILFPKSLLRLHPFSRILYFAGLVPTKSAGARLIETRGVYVASKRPGSEDLTFSPVVENQNPAEALVDGLLVLRVGKWKVRIVELVEDEVLERERNGESVRGWEEWRRSRGEA